MADEITHEVLDPNDPDNLAPEIEDDGQPSERSIAPQEWKNPPRLVDLKENLEDAKRPHDEQITKIQQWLDNLNIEGKAKPKVRKGRSSVQPMLIRKQAEWRYASLTEPFMSSPDLFNVHPVTYEDKEGAEQNAILLNNQFNHRLPRTRLIDEYVRTAVDEGTVILRTGWVFEEEQVTRMEPVFEYTIDPNAAPVHQQLHALMQNDPQRFQQEIPPEMQHAHQLSMQAGQPIVPVQVGEREVTETVTTKNQPTVEVCDTRNVTIDPTAGGNPDDARFIIYSFPSSLSELEKDGRYKNLDRINTDNNSVLSEPDHETEDPQDFNFSDKARKKFVVHEYWGYWDVNNDGIVEPFVAAWVGDTLIRLEDNPFPDGKPPFVVVPYLPVRRSVYGEPDGALLEDNQRITGAVMRGMIDILGRSANGQMGARKDALDLANKRKFEQGENYEFNGSVDPRQGFYMHTFPEIPNSAPFMLELQNNEAESLTGVKAFAKGLSGEALGNTATGIRGALDAASKRELGILRRLADGMVQVGRKIIAMNAVFLSEEEVVRVTNDNFVPIRRDDLAGHYDLSLTISTAEEDNNKAEQLAFMLQTMGNNMDPAMSKMILADIAKLRKMPALAEKIENYEPQPDPIEQERRQLENELLRADIREKLSQAMENEAEAVLDRAKAGTEMARAENLSADTDIKNLDFVEQETGVKQERDLEKQGAQAKAQMATKIVEASIKNQQKTGTS